MALDQILLFGDSLTQYGFDAERCGFGAAIADRYIRRLDVVNRGFSGYNTDWLLPILSKVISPAGRPAGARLRLLVIFLGANDSTTPPSKQHVPLDRYEANLRKMAEAVREADARTRLVFVGPPPVDDAEHARDSAAKGRDNSHTNELARQYSAACGRAAASCRIPFVDLHSRVTARVEESGGRAGCAKKNLVDFVRDGVHFSADGNRCAAEEIIACIELNFPELRPESIPRMLADWKDI